MTTLAIQIDACRGDYINERNTPFLFELKEKNFSSQIVPTFGFEPDGAYLAGLWPDECDGGVHFCYSPETSPFSIAKILPDFIDSFPDVVKMPLRKLLEIYVSKTTRFSRIKHCPNSCRIPFNLLAKFDLAQKYAVTENQFFDGMRLFSLLRNNNKSFFYHGAPWYPTESKQVWKGLMDASHPYDFIFLHLGDLDSVGHEHGPFSIEMALALNKVDRVLSEIWNYLNEQYGEFNFVLFGDHGMVEVEKVVDIRFMIEKFDLHLGDDFVYFLDSTLVRFWAFNRKAENTIRTLFQEEKSGHILTEEEKKHYHLHNSRKRFGDILYLANPGILFFPNFWNDSVPEKGMHGYIVEYPGQQSALIIHKNSDPEQNEIKGPVDMRRLYPTFLKLAGLNSEAYTCLQSIV
jgi:predicted AlkP superfamily pyrophosphatase or phosphodiesterase